MKQLTIQIFLALGMVTLFLFPASAQVADTIAIQAIQNFQEELQAHYRDTATSPLKQKAVDFTSHHFYPINLSYRVEASVKKISGNQTLDFATSSGKIKTYQKYCTLTFHLNDSTYTITAFRSLNKKYKDHLFIPFTDLTSGNENYGGGRYIDVPVPKGKTLWLDFNLCYFPYCAYTTGYSCPVPPAENFINAYIRAGITGPEEYH